MSSSSLESALVRILINDQSPHTSAGAGFLVTPKHVITCAHVVNNALGHPQNSPDQPDAEVLLDFPLAKKQYQVRAKILHWFPAQDNSSEGNIADVAVLELISNKPLHSGLRPVSLVVTEQQTDFSAESKVRMCGFPAGIDQGTYANGTLQGITAGGLIEIHSRDYLFAPRDEQKLQSYSIDEFLEQQKLLISRLQAMERDRILETRSEERLRLEHRIKDTRTERDSVEQRLTALQGNDTTHAQAVEPVTSGFDGTQQL